MDFFDKVKQVAVDVATVSGKQSKKLYSVAKLNLEIVEKQNVVKNLYKQIGFDAYTAHIQKADIVEAIKDKLEKIDELEEKIARIRSEIAEVKADDGDGSIDAEFVDADEYETAYDDSEVETEPID